MPPDNELTRDRLLAEESEKIGERAPIQRVVKRQCGKSNAQSNESSAEPSKSTNHFPNLSGRIRWDAQAHTGEAPLRRRVPAPECKGAAFFVVYFAGTSLP